MEEICNTVSTIDDAFVENTEVFLMSLTTLEPLVTIPVQSVVALILDNDGVFNSSCRVVVIIENIFIFIIEVALEFTQETFELDEDGVGGVVCVHIPSGYVIIRDIPFSVQSVLTSSTSAEGV